jgi:hypothetical protein
MIILRIRARDIATLIQQYQFDTIRIYRDTSPGGAFTTVAGNITPLSASQQYYEFADPSGTPSNYYEFTYLPSNNPSLETSKTPPFQGSIIQGPLGALTIGYVWASTEIVDLQNAPGSLIGEYIVRAETLVQQWAVLHGGLNPGAVNYAIILPIAARTLLEDLWLRNRPNIRARLAGGFTGEKKGHYSYTASLQQPKLGQWRDYFSDEVQQLLRSVIAGPFYAIHSKTTQVFVDLVPTWTPLTPNQDPNAEVKLWNDFLDIDFMPSRNNLLLGPGSFPITSHRWSD